MFCKFCGKRIDPTKNVCPYCSAPQETRSGGSGYWDILDDPSVSVSPARPAPAAQPVAPPSDSRLRAAIRKMQRINLLAWVVVLVCMLCALTVVTTAIRGSLVELSQQIEDIRPQPVENATVQSGNPEFESSTERRLEALAGDLSEISDNMKLILEKSEIFDSARILELCSEDGRTVFICRHSSTGGKWEYRYPAEDSWEDVPEQWKTSEITGYVSGEEFCLSLLIIEPGQWGIQSCLLRYQAVEGSSSNPIPFSVPNGALTTPGDTANLVPPTTPPPVSEPIPTAPSTEPPAPGSDTTPATSPAEEGNEGALSSQGGGTGGPTEAEGDEL